jgi:hypothetical protein
MGRGHKAKRCIVAHADGIRIVAADGQARLTYLNHE